MFSIEDIDVEDYNMQITPEGIRGELVFYTDDLRWVDDNRESVWCRVLGSARLFDVNSMHIESTIKATRNGEGILVPVATHPKEYKVILTLIPPRN